MKPESAMITKQDRLATWEEICRATVATPGRIMEQFYSSGTHYEIESESGNMIRYPAQEFEFFTYLSDMKNADTN